MQLSKTITKIICGLANFSIDLILLCVVISKIFSEIRDKEKSSWDYNAHYKRSPEWM